MGLLLFALIVLLLVGLCCYLLRETVPDARVANVGSIVLLVIGVLIIASRAGLSF